MAIRLTTNSNSTCLSSQEGDVNARVWIRIREIEQSLTLIEQILRAAGRLRQDPRSKHPHSGTVRALAFVEGFRGMFSPGFAFDAAADRAVPLA